MASRLNFQLIGTNRTPDAESINAVYRLLNGDFSSRKGHGMSVRFTAFDGRMSTGLLDVSKYALEVRNRETTQQRAFAARRADNKVVFAVENGIAKAVADTDSGTLPTQVIVHGTPAGGVLGGFYPDPTFNTLEEYMRIWPTMIVAWWGSPATQMVAGQLELVNAPGWVLCQGQTVTLRSGGIVATPNMNDRFPLGAGGTHVAGTTGGNTLANVGNLGSEHSHTGAPHSHPHNHPHYHQHTHTTPNHLHTVASHSHNHRHAIPVHYHLHQHTMAHVHSMQSHTHGPGNYSTTSHNHDAGSFSVASHAHEADGGSGQRLLMPSHSHGLSAHNHDSGGYVVANTDTGIVFQSGSGGGGDLDTTVNLTHGGTDKVAKQNHTHSMDNADIVGVSANGEFSDTPNAFNTTQGNGDTAITGRTAFGGGGGITGTSTTHLGITVTNGVSSGPSNNQTDQPTNPSTGFDNTGATWDGVDSATGYDATTHGPVSTNSGVGEGSGVTGGVAEINNNSDSAAFDGTPATFTANTGTAGSSIDATPPFLAWMWIMKL